jgi:uridine phosphorylase
MRVRIPRDTSRRDEKLSGLLVYADFPRTADQRVYHLGLRPGEVANRIVSMANNREVVSLAHC